MSHFRFRTQVVPVRPDGSGVSPDPFPQPKPAMAEPGQTAFRVLLQKLKGREVGLQVGECEYAGRLVSTDPVTLVSPDGAVTVVSGTILSIRY